MQAFILLISALLFGASFQAAHAQALPIYKKGAVIGFSRLQSDEALEGCSYQRLSGKIEHISRNSNGVRIDGFAFSQAGSKAREYVNVSLDRLPRVPAANLNQQFSDGIGRRIEFVAYACGAAGAIQVLDEIIFR